MLEGIFNSSEISATVRELLFSENKFKIGGGNEGLKVSWQITGIRHDPYAEQNRIQVEVEKEDHEKGYYLHNAEYGMPFEMSIQYTQKKDKETVESGIE